MESLTQSQIKQRLNALKNEHQELDFLITKEALSPSTDQIRARRLKKRKLAIKDEITQLENMLLPDIIA
ncbi:MAG: DUF465 domain-containing protein [Alphaproteobacteria bacterium]|nr:DUF465 domain-containing protein [Alphaproteobacteria bacterium]